MSNATFVTCKRYNEETLQVKYKDKTISDVLEMTVEEAIEFFQPISRIRHKLQTLADVGLSYVKLGQSATTLSGGEATACQAGERTAEKADRQDGLCSSMSRRPVCIRAMSAS